MTYRLELYRCDTCGNLVEVLLEGDGELVCCGSPMHHLVPKGKLDEGVEKHVPVISKNDCGNTVIRVGSVPHPMSDEHFIMFIQSISNDKNQIRTNFLNPGDIPKMSLNNEINDLFAREYCNIHGLWEGFND